MTLINEFTYKDENNNMHFMSDYIFYFLTNNIFEKNYIDALNNAIKTKTPNKKLDITKDIFLFELIYNSFNLVEHKGTFSSNWYTFELKNGGGLNDNVKNNL